ncbi:glycosyltransferase family A protein [Pedobacter sp. L105]|uniref:glycosyltransferase family 2 protein n=1 Tax=Pedobacter sp. L105 TaxID=1641871 RepID=UPI00131B650E|nr:glycosyltransferase family A protein [Pedobacter sp. L105]
MSIPLVTCIMPTANRQEFIPFAIDNFLKQDYSNAELVIIDDGIKSCADLIPDNNQICYFYTEPISTIGKKRNVACEKANGEFILNWDDDDWYAPDWISRQVNLLLISGADITGLNKIVFYSTSLQQYLGYEDAEHHKWLCGATLAFKKSIWKCHPFADLQVGEDSDFIFNTKGQIAVLDYPNGFIATLHDHNTSIKNLKNINTVTWMDQTNTI